jgi:hypothetical protein
MRTMRAKATYILALAVIFGLGALPAGARDLTGEFAVSSSEIGGGYLPAADMDASGEVVVVWADIVGRRFDRNGNPRGDDFQIGERTRSYFGPIEAALDDKGFTVAWYEYGSHFGSSS